MLTEVQIRAAKPGLKRARLPDQGGLYLEVSPTGSKTFRVSYRHEGSRKTMTLGEYPRVKLVAARILAARIKESVLIGEDPKTSASVPVPRPKTKPDQAPAGGIPQEQRWDTNCAEFIQKRIADGISNLTRPKLERNLLRTYPDLGGRDIATITPPDVLAIIRRLEAAEIFETAKDVRQKMSQVFRFAAAQGRCLHDPAAVIQIATVTRKSKKRPGLTKPKEVGGLMRAIRGYEGYPQSRAALLLSAYCFLRSTELRGGRWSEINWEEAQWIIPGARMKGDKPDHIVPLSRQAVEVLEWVHTLSGGGEMIFPAPYNDGRGLSDATLQGGLRRLGYCTKTEHTGHGFRTTFSTTANEHNWNRDWIEKQLGHDERNEVRGAYNIAQYLEGRTEMMQWYADWLDEQADSVKSHK